jgi:hypothetical protein
MPICSDTSRHEAPAERSATILSRVHCPFRATEANASRNSRSKSRDDTPTDQFALEFRNAREDSKHQPTIWRRCVHAFVQADEVDPQCTKFLQSIHQLPEAAGESVVAIDENRVHLTLTAIRP